MASQSPSSLPTPGKRKRTGSIQKTGSSQRSHRSASINPLSYAPSTLVQLTVAGLSETDELPSNTIPDFPHRGILNRASDIEDEQIGSVDEADEDDTEGSTAKPHNETKQADEPGGHLDVLLRSIHQFLDQGAINKAARAYGLILQLRPRGRAIDVRHHNLWAIGAELLMREGEQPIVQHAHDAQEESGTPKRWGSAANMNKVKAYLDTLIQQHPYDYRRPRDISAVDFWLAMLGCEVYNAHAEHVITLRRIEEQDEWHDDAEDVDDEDGPERAAKRRDELRLQALQAMKDITRRMDGLMQDLPYSKSEHFLRLRAMASLYVADLLVPASELPNIQAQGSRARELEQDRARGFLQKVVDNGGDLDFASQAILDPDIEKHGQRKGPLHSSLPIREV